MKINAQAFSLNSNYQRSRSALEASMTRLSTGDKTSQPGFEPASSVSISQRLRNNIARANASTPAIQTAISFIETASAYLDTSADILTRMMELGASAADGLKSASEREPLEVEFQALKTELTAFSRNSLFREKQLVGRDTVVSYDGNSDRVKFWLPDGGGASEITRDFGANAVDALGREIGFDASEDFSMSRDGQALYYLGTVAGDAAGKVRVKRYDIENHTTYTGSDLFDTGDKLFVAGNGGVSINGNGTIYDIEGTDLTRTTTAVTDITVGMEFSRYGDDVTYYRTDNTVVRYDVASTVTTALTGVIAFGAGVDSAFSASGRYIADENVAGQVRVIDTRSGNSTSYNVGAAGAVNNIQFNEDGDQLYYIDQTNNSVRRLNVATDHLGTVSLSDAGKVVQGRNNNSFNGLDLGGSNFGAHTEFVVSAGSISTLRYDAADTRLYALGLANSHVDTLAEADTTIDALKEAMNRLNAQRSKLGGQGARFTHVLASHRAYISHISTAESQIRDTDVALEASRMAGAQVRTQAAMAVLAQFNTISQNVLVLLQR
jgi:flagellin